MLQNKSIPTAWTRKDIATLAGGISVRTVERKFGKMLKPAELRASRREITYDPAEARLILIRNKMIPDVGPAGIFPKANVRETKTPN